MRALPIATLLVAAATACGKGGPPIDQKGPFLFRLGGKQTVVDNVEWGKTEERNGMVGRKGKDGRKIPSVTSGTFATKPFTVDGKTVSIDFAFDMGKTSGGITIDGKACGLGERFSLTRGEVQGVRYRGFSGTCDLDGKQTEFTVGPVRDHADQDDPEE
ncbi:MAG: hypothetical protein KF773_30205 [Deltaproteobacteria bacterium]|nr:hypothetical protein [Deltaproteobacteria bacterium]MCW5806830.1 hypothetical protein [Deltaproteobacteria bacterium]